MEFFYRNSRRNNGSSSTSLKTKLGVSTNFDDVISGHVVFRTRNVTKSLPEVPHTKPKKCILRIHGLTPEEERSKGDDQVEQTLNLLPLTICTKHGKASFLPFDCVAKLPEFSHTTRVATSFSLKASHSCILEFPYPPPISSTQEKLLPPGEFANKCYHCISDITYPTSIYMYRDYLFCSPGCRYKACMTHYWYKKVMNIDDEDDEEETGSERRSERVVPVADDVQMEGGGIFFIDI